jgi:23S rRNA pseudouridine2605 synthase
MVIMMDRLQKVISDNGYTSRRKAEELIKNGKVLVNGEVATIGMKVSSSDEIMIDGNLLTKDSDSKVYYLLNKPRGIVCTSSDEKGRKTVIDLIETDKRIYPVGRLDYDTTGVLLLTNDGELTNKLIHPKNNIDKVYLAKIKGIINGVDINKLKNGVKIDNYKTSPARVKLKSFDKKSQTSLVELTIHEGHNHQVKKMFEVIGFDVIKLTRLSFAGIDVKSLKSGEYRKLSLKEVQKLYSLVK